MAITTERWTDRVQKLLTQADDNSCTKEEKETFLAKAYEIMAKHGISQAMAEAAKPVKDIVTDIFKSFDAPYAIQKQTLYCAIAKAFNCQAVIIGKRVHCFGFRSDLDTVEELYTVLLLHGTSALNQEEIWENAKSYRVAWWYGYTAEIQHRLKQANAKETEKVPGSAIVLRDRSLATQAAMVAQYPKTGLAKRTYRSTGGYERGQAEGRRVGLGNAQVGNARRTALH